MVRSYEGARIGCGSFASRRRAMTAKITENAHGRADVADPALMNETSAVEAPPGEVPNLPVLEIGENAASESQVALP